MIRRMVLLVACLGVAAPLWAQTPAPVEDPAKPQVQAFEMVLRGAVDLGGQRFAQQAAKVVPNIYLAPFSTPVVVGLRIEGVYWFDVQVPRILQTGVLYYMDNAPRRSAGGAGAVAARPVASPGRVGATAGDVPDDPMTQSPVAGDDGQRAASVPDPDTQYSAQVKDALIDAMLDSSGVLPMTAGDRLVIVVSGTGAAVTNPLYRDERLILTVKSSDLADLHQGKLTRDAVKQRITQTVF
ncbi:MAG TPA: hypothetical protein VHD57_15775 [Vicinamibacterales bacterium]|nr:hypothetical protein [Vicinamibacterales bacterium]